MVRLTDRPDMTLDVYHGRKTTIQQHKFTTKFIFLCDGQGTIKRAILYSDRTCWNVSVKREYLHVNTVELQWLEYLWDHEN